MAAGQGKKKEKPSSKKSKKKADADDDENDADDDDAGERNVVREIIRGPCVHVPEPDEWTHSFSWHGTDPSNKTRKVPNALKFKKLRVIPDQMYYNVNGKNCNFYF